MKYGNPKEVGPDRITNAVAAYRMRRPVIVVDYGTAPRSMLSLKSEYLGGAIARHTDFYRCSV